MAATPDVELELDFLVWKDKNGTEQITPAHTFPSGTKQIFYQSNAPVGWTKDTNHNDKALRVVTGTVSSGGNSSFSSAMASRGISGNVSTNVSTNVSVSNRPLNSVSQMPSHRHYTTARHNKNNSDGSTANAYSSNGYTAKYQYTNYQGGNGSHNHGANASSNASSSFTGTNLDMRIKYVDVIIAAKD